MILLALAALAAQAVSPGTLEHFEKKVRPILVKRCQGCHGAARQFGGLRLDTRDGVKRVEARLLDAVKRTGTLKMPPEGPLPAAEVSDLERWVAAGTPWPEAAKNDAPGAHWAFKTVRPVEVPVVPNTMHPVDRFLRLRLFSEGIFPAPMADRATLARRLSFVLTGLPPTPEEVDQFLQDRTPGAYERIVDRLLRSPHYGERWARHWMDVVRFGETLGYEWNYEVLGAWRYRDYLIRAFNADVGYDQFVREHIAGDLLDKPRVNEPLQINESVIGTAFFRLGEAGHDDCVEFREICLDQVDNQIDTLGKAFQGLTIACARCHDHKVDPIPTADYYALQGVLLSSRPVTHTLDRPERFAPTLDTLARLKEQLRKELAGLWLGEAAAHKFTAPTEAGWDSPLRAILDPDHWNNTVAEFRREALARRTWNSERFTLLDNWSGTFGESPAGEFAIAAEGDRAISGVYPRGWFTHLLSEKRNGSLRSGLLPRRKFVSLELTGGKLGAVRTIIDNGQIGEVYQTVDKPQLSWLRLSGQDKVTNQPVYLELLTKHDNPRFPDRPGRLKKEEAALLDQPRSFIGLRRAYLHDAEETPKPELDWLERLYAGERPPDLNAIARQTIEAWRDGKATDADVQWIVWLLDEGILSNCKDTTPGVAELVAQYRQAEGALPEPRTISGLGEGGQGFDVPVLPYGDWKNPGPKTPRGYLKLVSNGAVETPGSGRRELAEAIANASNPLTARVMVNRIWHHVFGQGLVATPDNFGRLAEPPSHAELLDWLAGEFVRNQWSVKHVVRLLVTSQAFQQSSQSSARSRELDPRNRLLQHYPLRRLDAESIRDAMLAVSGRLDPTLYGESVHPYREKPQDYRRLFSGPLDGAGRRSLYLKVTRMEGARFLDTFDYPPPLVARGARDVTNVPAQALALLNDPFVLDQAATWAGRLIERGSNTVDTRLDRMFLQALSRHATGPERERFRALVAKLATESNIAGDDILRSRDLWKDVAHAFFNLKEFLYLP